MTRRPLLLAVLAAALTGPGCGGGTGASDAGPAALVPPDATLYVQATVKPEGQLREDALAAAGKVLDTPDPAAKITELVSEAVGSGAGSNLDYARDIEPWLGDEVAVWMSGTDYAAEFKGVAVAATTDPEKARESIRAALRREGKRVSTRSHEGIDYEVDGEGDGYAIVEEFVALGTEAELKRTIDAAAGESLAENETYRTRMDELPDGRLGHLYADAGVLFKAGAESGEAGAPSAEEYEQLKTVFPVDDLGHYAMALSVTDDRVVIDSSMSAKPSEAFRQLGALTGGVGTELVGELPGDAWGAFGIPDLGETARFFFNRFAGALGGAAFGQQLRQETGLDLDRDVFSWIGDAAFFVRGTDPDAIDGGAVIAVTDTERAASAFGKLAGALRKEAGSGVEPVRIEGAESAFAFASPGQPKPVVLARSAERVVVAYGEAAAAAGLAPDQRLSDTRAFGQAKDLLGDEYEPSVFLTVAQVLELIEASGQADAEFAEVKAYIDAFTVVAIGGESTDDTVRSRIAAGLK